MAGAITHLLIAEGALEHNDIPPQLSNILRNAKPFLLLGSVSPDLPYASKQGRWADRMHYLKTNLVPIQCAISVGCGNLMEGATREQQMAWVAGYISHCVADATIHPIVQKITGPYHADPDVHRQCEMIQDSLLFSEIKRANLQGSHFIKQLKECGSERNIRGILDNWVNSLRLVYGQHAKPAPQPEKWLIFYFTLVKAASDAELLNKITRVSRPLNNWVYPVAEDIERKRHEEASHYYYSASLPLNGNRRGSFREYGYQRAIDNLIPIWNDLWEDIQNARNIGPELERSRLKQSLLNWDLDTGADMDMPDMRVTYWR